MRKNLKKQIVEIINTMSDAENSLEQGILDKNTDILNVIADLQDTAIQIGNVIEESEGEGHSSVAFIERYCETLWFLYEKVNKGEFDCISDYMATICAFDDVQKSIDTICVRREIVFLPYNASMWDSLESVWRAACADDKCDVYVIPIPYFDKNPDGSFGEMHYEGDKFPNYVPITHFDDYSLKDNHPDIIFIHNPYDDCNVVTSVHPHFYSKNIKDYTEKLVYIPYFVLEEINPDNEAAVNRIEHFCLLPGVIHADKIILQSEKMKQTYIKKLVEYAGENTRRIWEEKIHGIGSPKFDKVINTQKDKLVIPSEWAKIIKKENGTDKNVVFYNTTIGALLKYGKDYFDKISEVINVFKENRAEVALLWRPHPLFKNTVERVYPELLERYEKIVSDYLDEKWGIYDDTSEFERAISISDAYFGDRSSAIYLYERTNKKIMLQNIGIHYEDRIDTEKELQFEAIAFVDENIAYGASATFNGLFKIIKASGECEYINIFPSEAENGKRLFFAATFCNEKVVFAPQSANCIAVYDVDKNNITNLSFKTDNIVFNPMIKFADVVAIGKYVYLIGASYPYVIKLDTDTYEMEYIHMNIDEPFLFRKGTLLDDNRYFIPSVNSNVILEVDLINEKIRHYKLNCNFKGAWNICFDGKAFWLPPRYRDSGFIRWEADTGLSEEFKEFPEGYVCDGDFNFHSAYYADGNIIAIPELANMFVKIDTENKKMKAIETLKKSIKEKNGYYFHHYNELFLVKKKAEELFFTDINNEFFKIDIKTLQVNAYKFVFSAGVEKFKCDRIKSTKDFIVETTDLKLIDLIKLLPELKDASILKEDGSYGEQIYTITRGI